MAIVVRVQDAPIDVGAELARVAPVRPDVGAMASFVGFVRDRNAVAGHDAAVAALTLEHYPGMTERSLESIARQACDRWPLADVVVVHRTGTMAPTDAIVFVAAASSHRDAAFDACRFVMDWLKTEAPFWKKETTADGARWVEARDSDVAARDRWCTADPSA